MLIEQRPIDQVRPYDRNPRVNDGAAVDAVVKSITEFGWRQPIVVDADGVIIAGHTRWKAARRMGLTHVPVHVADLDPVRARAYRLADNQAASIARWDMDLLHLELRALEGLDFDLSLLGFPDADLAEVLSPPGNAGLTDPDEVPEPPAEAATRPGDLWVLGHHRLLCGDSARAEDVDRLLEGQAVHLVNTDPPYNVRVEPRSNNAIAAGLSSFARPEDRPRRRSRGEGGTRGRGRPARRGAGEPGGEGPDPASDPAGRAGRAGPARKRLRAKDRPLANDFVPEDEFSRLLAAWFANIARALVPGGAFYIWGGYANCGNYPPALRAAGLYFSQSLIWDKQHPVLTRKDFMGAHEWCFYGWREGAAHRFYGPANVPDLWHVKKVNPNAMVHLTEKPVELAARAMAYSSRPGERVLDLFGGSGSTLIAAEQQGRRAFLVELDPLYCDVIVQRWEKFTGRKAERHDARGDEQPGLAAPEKTPGPPGVGGAA